MPTVATAWQVGMVAALLGETDPIAILSTVVGTLVLALGGFVGLRTYQARRQVDRVTVGLTSLESSLARADKDRELQDARHAQDIARMEERHHEALSALERRITDLVEAHEADNERCDRKLRRLGHIVKDLGGEVPDDLNGLNPAA